MLEMRSRALPSPLIIPSAVDPPARGAGQAPVVKMERPAGRTILTTGAWSARLAPGRWQAGSATTQATCRRRATVTIIPEPERPRRRRLRWFPADH